VAHARDSQPTEPGWPDAKGRRIVFLIDAASPLEERLLHEWIARHRPADIGVPDLEAIPLPPSRGRHRRLDPRLEARLATGDDPLLAPLRVAWQPRQRGGVRAVRLRDLLTFGDPRDPGRLRQAWVLRRHPDRCCVVAGEPAPVSELRERWQRAGGADAGLTTGLPEFVARQAALALERAERRLRGTRYKVPRLVHEDILARPAWRGGLARLAREVGRDEESVARTAAGYLREIAATHSTYVIDLVANLIRYIYTLGYGEALHYDRSQLEGLYALAQRYPVVFLPSHKSNLDHLVLQYALHENGHPPNHTAGGINMNFFPMGPLVRRSGVFFIRRTFKDNAVYKFVLRQYIDYLIEKRFPLEWYIEGGRSRSGKLLPPHYGLLAYVADAYRRAKSEDVYLIPTSIAYDQIQDIGDYVAEQRGGTKERESFGWFLRVLRRLRRRYGNIHIRFGEPLSLAGALGPPDPHAEPRPDEESLALRKLAFEVSLRINRVTPITPTALVTLALLGTLDCAVTVAEAVAVLHGLAEYVRRRGLPTTGELDLETPDGVRRALDALVDSGIVSCFADGPEAVYFIAPEQLLTAAYYRNTIIHFFVNGAIAAIALGCVAGDAPSSLPGTERFWNEALRLRDLLKFEFFFPGRDAFRAELRAELALHEPQWERRLGAGEITAVRQSLRPCQVQRVLLPYLDAYGVVADALAAQPADAPLNEPAFLAACVARGTQYHLQRRIGSAESVSKILYENGLRLARNRQLADPPAPDLAARRRAFADDIRATVEQLRRSLQIPSSVPSFGTEGQGGGRQLPREYARQIA
jgi:glycerol-3-phosphate O-acyltransferase